VASSESAQHRQPSLGDSLELMRSSVPTELVGPEAWPWLASVAAVLPPLHHAGFECRLGATETAVDLQQVIFAIDGEPHRLARFLAQAESTNEAWARVQELAERWSAPDDPLHGGIDEIWLELDAPLGVEGGALALGDARPSVFGVFERAEIEALPIASELLGVLVSDTELPALEATVRRVSLTCPRPARISHIGVMLGRSPPGLRVHVRHLPLQEIDGFLAGVGWRGDRAELVSLATALLDHGDWLVVCLDVLGDQVLRVGLECFFTRKHGLDPRWPGLLEHLTALGLSSAEKAGALLTWPGTLTPLNSSRPWPDDLIAQSLTQPEDSLSLIDRRLSHVKLTFAPGHAVSAKAYFWYVHAFARGAPAEADHGHLSGESVP
jgi:hypothetical protein